MARIAHLTTTRGGRGRAAVTTTHDGARIVVAVRTLRGPAGGARVDCGLNGLHEATPETVGHAARLVGDCCAAYLGGRMPMGTLALALAFALDPHDALAVARSVVATKRTRVADATVPSRG